MGVSRHAYQANINTHWCNPSKKEEINFLSLQLIPSWNNWCTSFQDGGKMQVLQTTILCARLFNHLGKFLLVFGQTIVNFLKIRKCKSNNAASRCFLSMASITQLTILWGRRSKRKLPTMEGKHLCFKNYKSFKWTTQFHKLILYHIIK